MRNPLLVSSGNLLQTLAFSPIGLREGSLPYEEERLMARYLLNEAKKGGISMSQKASVARWSLLALLILACNSMAQVVDDPGPPIIPGLPPIQVREPLGCAGPLRFLDRGLTVLDCQTNLEWEKKLADNIDDVYTWTGVPLGTNFDGTAADYINALNTLGFAGHSNWRLPMVAQDGGTAELETLVDLNQGACAGGFDACINPIFGPTAPDLYWSSVTKADFPRDAWIVDFSSGGMLNLSKPDARRVRAVRTVP